jgi:outer membrane protein assembly factor BamB
MHESHLPRPRRNLLMLIACQIAMILALSSNRAAAVEPAWSVNLDARIVWQQVTTLGDLIVGTTDGLSAIDAESGQPRWSRPDLGDMRHGSFEEIIGSPLIVLDDGQADPRTVILNMLNGTLVFDSRAENLTQIASRYILSRNGSLFIAGLEVGQPTPTLFLYDIESGRRLWSSDVLTAGMGGFMQLLMTAAIVMTDTSPVQSAPFELDDGTFILGAMGNLYRFDHDSGDVLWKTQFAGGRFELTHTAQRPGVIYAGAEETDENYTTTQYQGFRIADGEPVWRRPERFSKPMNSLIVPIADGLIVSEGDSDKGRLRLLDYDSGDSLWGRRGRGLEIKGQVLDYVFTDAGLLLTTGYDSIWTNRDTEYLVYVVDYGSGTLRFEDPLEVRGRMLTTELTDHGLLYITTHEINIFDPATGALRNGNEMRSRDPLAWTRDASNVFAYNPDSDLVHALNMASGSVTAISSTPFEFQEKDDVLAMDLTGGNIVLMGRQSIAGLGIDGSALFDAHYPAPRDPAWLRGLAIAAGIRAGMASAAAGLYSAAAASAAADTAAGSVERELAVGFSEGFGQLSQGYAGLAGDYIEFARRRYQASAQSRDFVFMMTRDEERNIALVQVSKLNGEILGSIDLGREKEPNYQVDDIANQIYYRLGDSMIVSYQFGNTSTRVAQASP